MSRIGNRIITIPAGVTVEEADGIVTVKGPKGELKQPMLKDISMKVEGTELTLERANENAKAMHGTMNALVNNMIIGVTKGYEKGLEIVGVGYRFNVQGKKLVINAGCAGVSPYYIGGAEYVLLDINGKNIDVDLNKLSKILCSEDIEK